MEGIQFALPTVSSSAMTKDEQGALIVNQATAIIVAAYLDYLARVYSAIIATPNITDYSLYRVNENEIGPLIDNVQNALKSF
jgi:hypothetical protein